MIVVGLMGGLGNQMFQYACAKSTAKRLNKSLRLDITMLLRTKTDAGFSYRDFELKYFNISEETVTKLTKKETVLI